MDYRYDNAIPSDPQPFAKKRRTEYGCIGTDQINPYEHMRRVCIGDCKHPQHLHYNGCPSCKTIIHIIE